jgi:hypothetical protein
VPRPYRLGKTILLTISSSVVQFLSWRLWTHFLISLANNGPLRAFDTYGPSIVTSFGFPALSSNAMASVGLYIQIPIAFAFSYVSDRL